MILTTFEDKSFLEFASGSFDDWCVFVVTPINRYAPKDTEYFERLVFYANKYSAESLYKFFVDVYDYTTKDINSMMFDAIKFGVAIMTDDGFDAIYNSYRTRKDCDCN